MPDGQFYKTFTLIMCDLFGYRVDLSPAQFFEQGYTERKLILILDLYDILKRTRKGIKINNKLDRVERGAPHATDEAVKEYQVVNHRDNVARNMVFKINTQMQKRSITCVEAVDLDMDLRKEGDGANRVTTDLEDTANGYVPLRGNMGGQATLAGQTKGQSGTLL